MATVPVGSGSSLSRSSTHDVAGHNPDLEVGVIIVGQARYRG